MSSWGTQRWESGYLRIGKLWGAPLRVHWSAPIAAVFFTGLRFAPLCWFAAVVLIMAHELGHAIVARAFHQRILSLNVNALGGECIYSGNRTPVASASIAWGGVWAQLLIMAASGLVLFLVPGVPAIVQDALVSIFIRLNGIMMLFNLIPYGTLDGAKAWPLFRLLYLKFKLRGLERQSTAMRAPGTVTPIGSAKSKRKGSPPLRIVYGGVADELGLKDDDHDPPKDKRTLN